MKDPEAYFEEQDYRNVKEIPGRGMCAIFRFAFTTGLVIGMKLFDYYGRYCYQTAQEAQEALNSWNGEGDPSGNWIKYKGYGGERSNIKTEELETLKS